MRALRILKSCCDNFRTNLTAYLLGALFVDMHLAKSGFVSVRFAKFTRFVKGRLSSGILQICTFDKTRTLLKI